MLRVLSEKICGWLVPGCHPGMCEDLPCGQSSAGIHVQHLSDDVLGETGDRGPVAGVHVVLTLPDPLEDVLRRVFRTGSKRSLSCQHGEEQNTQTPNITGCVITLENDQ